METAEPSSPPPLPEMRFLDPQEIIEHSRPAPRTGLMWYAVGGFLLVVLMSTIAGQQSAEAQAAVRALAGAAMLVLMVVLSTITWFTVNRQREEQRQLEAAEEKIHLRQWPEAAVLLQGLLGQPMRSPQARQQGLLYATAILSRYHRYQDAMAVQNYLLEEAALDGPSDYAIRLGRAMAMLQEDQLVDADRAISELRRAEGSEESGALALVEIYRDVKTGHPAEAIELFKSRQAQLRKQLGHRIAEAWALVAKAYDMVGQDDAARAAYANATVLAPIAEISRKYSEVATLTGKYQPAAAPAE